MNLNLLNIDNTAIFGTIIFVAFIALAVFLFIVIKKRVDSNYKTAIDYSKIDGKSQLVKHVPFMWPKEVEFFEMFKKVLPSKYMVIPKVCVGKIVKPHGNLILFNAIKDKFVDYVVLLKDKMEPVVVVECFYPAITDGTVKEMDESIKVALKSVNIPIIRYEILDHEYNKEEVLRTFLDCLDPVALAELRKSN